MKKSERCEEIVEQELTERQHYFDQAAAEKRWTEVARQHHMAQQCLTLLYCIRVTNHTCPRGVTE